MLLVLLSPQKLSNHHTGIMDGKNLRKKYDIRITSNRKAFLLSFMNGAAHTYNVQ
jgi:hypothetical protein